MPFTLVSLPFTEATPNLIDPADLGAAFSAIPAGSLVEAFILSETLADQPGDIYLVLAAGVADSGSQLALYDAANSQGHDTNEQAVFLLKNTAGVVDVSNLSPGGRALTPCQLFIGVYSSGAPITTIAGTLIAKIYS